MELVIRKFIQKTIVLARDLELFLQFGQEIFFSSKPLQSMSKGFS